MTSSDIEFMQFALKAGIGYFAAMFGLGFVLGSARVALVAPAVGVLPATLIELPIMLLVSWRFCVWMVRRFGVSSELPLRLAMGLIAFILLITAETILGVVGFRQTLSQQLAGYRETGPMLGLLAQIATAAFPIIQAKLDP